MPDDTDILSLPLILPNQAQKHVTHNEALAVLDVIVQLAVINRDQTAPPALAAIGDRHIVPVGATADWAGQEGRIAVFTETGWQFHVPLPGWQARVIAEGETAVFDGLAWVAPSQGSATFAELGISASADSTNRLTVSSAATLFNHAGAGHQLKLNKATPGDTASLLFQTGFSGRVELGTAGDDDLSVKVSPDGSAWTTALTVAGASGRVGLPQGAALPAGTSGAPALSFETDADTGLALLNANEISLIAGGVARASVSPGALTVDVPVQGLAVTQSQVDSTPGRLIKVGDYGFAGNAIIPTNWDDAQSSGAIYAALSATNAPLAGSWFIGTYHYMNNLYGVQRVTGFTGAAASRTWSRRLGNGIWSPWREEYNQGSLLGPVSQSAGVPTGALIERGSNANGEYVRLADGTQICTRVNLSAANASTALGSMFRSSSAVTWTYPAAFVAAPAVTGDMDDADCWMTTAGAPTATTCSLRALSAVTKAGALTMRATAVGRWF